MRLLEFAALRRAGFALLALAAAALGGEQTTSAQAPWSANPSNPVYCGIPRTLNDVGMPSDPPLLQAVARGIQFEVPIEPGVHEGFDVQVVGVMGLHQFPAGTTDPIAAFFAANPTAHFAYQYLPIALMNDCDGDGVYALGPGNPPCWGAPTASLRPDVVPAPLPANIRSSTPFNCSPRPTFLATVSAPPLLNGGVVGIRIVGRNQGLFLGMSAYSDEDTMLAGHSWVHLEKRTAPFMHKAYGKWGNLGPNSWNITGPGVILQDSLGEYLHTAWFPVTVAEWNAAVAVINRYIAACTDWTPWANCTDFAAEVMGAAGCPIPSVADNYNFSTPRAFNRSCRQILLQNGGRLPRCGYIVFAPPPMVWPRIMNPAMVIEQVTANPAAAANELGYEFVALEIQGASVRTKSPLSFDIARQEDSLVWVDFGDGTTVLHEGEPLVHAYASSGLYAARVLSVQHGRVSVRTAMIAVQSKGRGSAAIACDIPAVELLPPGEAPPQIPYEPWLRTLPADVTSDWQVNGEDLAFLLALWGSKEPSIADIDDDGVVSGSDLAVVLAGWGASVN